MPVYDKDPADTDPTTNPGGGKDTGGGNDSGPGDGQDNPDTNPRPGGKKPNKRRRSVATPPTPPPTNSDGRGRRRAVGTPEAVPVVPEEPVIEDEPPIPPPPPKKKKPISKPAETALTHNGRGAIHNIIYGTVGNIGCSVADVVALSNGRFLVRYIVGYGPIKSISNIRIDGLTPSNLGILLRANDAVYPTGYQVYLGTPNQSTSKLMENIDGWIPSNYPGVAYIVAIFPKRNNQAPNIFNLLCDVEGLYIYDPTQDQTLTQKFFSEDPALICADLLISKRYGGRIAKDKINWDIIRTETTPYVMQTLTGGKKRYPIGICIKEKTNLDDLLNNICDHAQLWITFNSGKYQILADMPRSWSGVEFTDDNILPGSAVRSKGSSEVFERLDIEYTDRADKWTQKSTEVELPGLGGNDIPIDYSSKALYGTRELQQAKRIGVYHLNKSQLDIVFTWKTNLSGTRALPGDIVKVTSTEMNLNQQLILIEECEPSNGTWSFVGHVYDPSVYSDTIITEVAEVRPTLPSPFEVPLPPTALSITDQTYTDANGQSAYRIKISFTPANVPYNGSFNRIKIRKTPYGQAVGEWVTVQENTDTTYYIYDSKKGDSYEVQVTTVTEAPYSQESSVLTGAAFVANNPAGPVGPQGPQGPQGASVSIEYSVDGLTNWTAVYASTHQFMRQRIGTGAWSAAIRIADSSAVPPALLAANITFEEAMVQHSGGSWTSHGRIALSAWPTTNVLLAAAEIWITIGGTARYWCEIPYSHTFIQTPDIPLGTYTLTFYVRSRYGVRSAAVTKSVVIDGVTDVPPPIAGFLTSGGKVYWNKPAGYIDGYRITGHTINQTRQVKDIFYTPTAATGIDPDEEYTSEFMAYDPLSGVTFPSHGETWFQVQTISPTGLLSTPVEYGPYQWAGAPSGADNPTVLGTGSTVATSPATTDSTTKIATMAAVQAQKNNTALTGTTTADVVKPNFILEGTTASWKHGRDIATWRSGAASSTGAIVFTARDNMAYHMMRGVIDLYQYVAGAAVGVVEFGAYSNAGTSVVHPTMLQHGAIRPMVRFGFDSTGKFCVILDDIATIRNYYGVRMREISIGHIDPIDTDFTGWTVSLVTSLAGYTGLVTAVEGASFPWIGITGKPTTIAGYGITDIIAANIPAPIISTSIGNLTGATVAAQLAELLDEKAPISPLAAGLSLQVTTEPVGDNSNDAASTAFVQTAIKSKVITNTTVWDPPSMTVGGTVSISVTVTGAAAGDIAIAQFPPADSVPLGDLLTRVVATLNSVTVTYLNVSAGSINLASGTLRVAVIKS